MSKLLFDEHPLVVDPHAAKVLGLNEAIVLQQIHYWLQPERNPHMIEGTPWIYNSLSEWKTQFPFWSESTIYRTLDSLESKHLIKVGNFNKRKGDRTKWYTIQYDELKFLEDGGDRNSLFQNETASSQNGTPSRQDGTTLPETTTETNTETTAISRDVPTGDEEFAMMFQSIEGAMGGKLTPRECDIVSALWGDRPDFQAHHYAYVQTRDHAGGFNLNYYEKCLRGFNGNRRQIQIVREATFGSG